MTAGPVPSRPESRRPQPDRPERTDEEWAAIFREDLASSQAAERRLLWMELIALGVVAALVVLHFVWH
jgi:hypothetical protein